MNFQIAPKSTETKLNWNDAMEYCQSLNIDDKTGWRLPTKEELNDIYQSENDFEERWYWSSTEGNGNYAWYQSFFLGDQSNYGKDYGVYYVRAIRSTV